MNENKPWISIAIKYGIITGLISVIITLINFITGVFNSVWTGLVIGFLIALAITIGGIVFAHRNYKKLNDGFMTYGRGLLIGTVVAVVASILTGIVVFIYTSYIDAGVFETMKEMQLAILEKFNVPDDKLDEAMVEMEKDLTPGRQLYKSLSNGIIGGFIFSLIISAFTKKTRPEFE